jgi:nitrite reductase/ring-hydroxylating ferredoxin subunit
VKVTGFRVDDLDLDKDQGPDEERGLGFNDVLLLSIVALMVTMVLFVIGLYGRPSERLEAPEVQPAIRVARVEDVPVGASRLVRWGARAVLVVHLSANEFVAVAGTSPNDGCLLEWEEEAARIVSPCTYVVYDVDGSVVAGLSTTPLVRYPVFIRSGTLYVARG